MREKFDDWRWWLAHLVWAPGAAVEARLERWMSRYTRYMPDRLRMLACLEVLEGFRSEQLPWRFRAGRALIGNPCGRLSEVIFPGWSEDPRAKLSYWQKDAAR